MVWSLFEGLLTGRQVRAPFGGPPIRPLIYSHTQFLMNQCRNHICVNDIFTYYTFSSVFKWKFIGRQEVEQRQLILPWRIRSPGWQSPSDPPVAPPFLVLPPPLNRKGVIFFFNKYNASSTSGIAIVSVAGNGKES